MAEVLPLHVLLTAMRRRWEAGDVDGAVALAKAAAPYLHRKAPSSTLGHDLAGVPDDELSAYERGGGGSSPQETEELFD